MVQAGYGKEIVRIVNAMPYEKLFRTGDVADRLAERFSIDCNKARTVTNVKLKRMADSGDIKRIGKGIYCRVQQTVFGPLAPDADQIIARDLIMENGTRIGYESGFGLLNRLGLSTLLPCTTEITTNQYRYKLPKDCHIRLIKPATPITDGNWKYLQFIDAAGCLSNAHVDAEDPRQIMKSLAEKRGLDLLTLIFTARKYYSPETVLHLIDLLEGGADEITSR